jgi:RNA polymerase sigma factor (sigma-70 family)
MARVGGINFASTIWTQIRMAKEKDPEAVDRLLKQYRAPIFNYLRNHGFSQEDADDLVQESLLKILKDDLLLKAEKEKGRFRSLLLGITRNVVGDWLRAKKRLKRGGDFVTLSLDATPGGDSETSFGDMLAQEGPDEDFAREWAVNLLRLGMDRLREECEGSGSRHFETLFLHMNDPGPYGELAEKMKAKESDIRNWIHHAKRKLRIYLEGIIQQYCSSPEEYAEENACLKRFFKDA